MMEWKEKKNLVLGTDVKRIYIKQKLKRNLEIEHYNSTTNGIDMDG